MTPDMPQPHYRPLMFACPRCQATRGNYCKSRTGYNVPAHAARVKLADQADDATIRREFAGLQADRQAARDRVTTMVALRRGEAR